MDYRKPVVFGENWSPSRYKVLPYFAHEKRVITAVSPQQLILDFGCASGWNMSRFLQYGRQPNELIGMDVVPERVQLATQFGQISLGSGLQLPFADGAFQVIYIQHVLHHIGDVDLALREVRRCLRPGGTLFLIETAEDNPLIYWGRKLYPSWMGDEINAPFRFAGLRRTLAKHGFEVRHAEQYSVIFWAWEILPDQFGWFEKITPLFVAIEQVLVKFLRRYSAHCFYVAVS